MSGDTARKSACATVRSSHPAIPELESEGATSTIVLQWILFHCFALFSGM
jgi:hypothetical protein